MKHIRNISLFLFIAVSAFGAEADTVRILGVGNSFTYNSVRFLPSVVKSGGLDNVEVGWAIIGGSPLEEHVAQAMAHEADPAAGNAYGYKVDHKSIAQKTNLKFILQDREWDFITIQQVSSKSFDPESYYPYAKQLIDYIQRYAPDAEIVLHETWAHSIDSHRVKAWDLSPDQMYAQLHAAYTQVAGEYGLRLIPVGTAFENAKATPMWDYQPTTIDVDELEYTEGIDNLPDESKSLHTIFKWQKARDGKWFVRNDGFHASMNGQYLGALVWYAFFFDRDPREVSYRPRQISEEQAASLREIAYQTVHSE